MSRYGLPEGQYEFWVEAQGRADAAVAAAAGITRSAAARLIEEARVHLQGSGAAEGALVAKASQKLAAGETVRLEVPVDTALQIVPEQVDGFGILYEDEDLVIVDKPAGVAAHPSPGWHGATVVSALLGAGYRISTSGASERQGIVHRLDVGTSGAMVVAKSERAYTGLKAAFKDRTVDKIYHTVVQGLPDPLKGTIKAPIGRHPGHEWKFAVVEGGRDSVTHYEVLEAFGTASLAQVHLETGRTHQIRVHFSALNHPCAGDITYGANPRLAADLGLTRQWLHARTLGFEHPVTGERIEATSPYPEDLDYALRALRGEVEL